MQPRSRQVPPNRVSLSMTAVFRPKLTGANGGNITAGTSSDNRNIKRCLFLHRSPSRELALHAIN